MAKNDVKLSELTEDEYNMFFLGVYDKKHGKLIPNPNYRENIE